MKKYFFIALSILTARGQAQLSWNVQVPPAGLALKSQLWNVLVTNSSSSAISIHAELKLSDYNTHVPVMNAVTGMITLAPGNQLLQANSWAPVQYNIVDPNYQGFATTEFLPVGRFLACYTIVQHDMSGHYLPQDECEMIEVEALSPPQLVYPSHQSEIDTYSPVFNWIAPAPVNLFTAMNYDLELVEVYPGQTEADAINKNIPVLRQSRISSTSFPYAAGAPALESDKKYAWRILANNNNSVVAQSETWWFTVKKDNAQFHSDRNVLPYAKLKRDNGASYTIAQGDLKFEYLNETTDTVWNIKLIDLSAKGSQEMTLPLDSVRLRRGQNQVRIPASKLKDLTDKHIYLLELRNSRKELWQLKFAYRRKEEE